MTLMWRHCDELSQPWPYIAYFEGIFNNLQKHLIHLPLDKMTAILTDDIFKCIFLNENDKIPIQISLKLVPRGPIDNKPPLVQVMVWRRKGDKPLPEALMAQVIDAYMRHKGKMS